MRIILFIFLLTNFLVVNAQKNQPLRDSILKYQFSNPNLAIEYGMEYVELRSGDIPDKEMVNTYSKIGEILLYMELYSSSLDYFNTSLSLLNSIQEKDDGNALHSSDNPPWIVLNIGNIYFKNRNYQKALEKFEQARSLFEIEQDPIDRKNGLYTSNSNIGLVYGAKGDFDKQEAIYYKVYDNLKSNPVNDRNYKSTVLYSMSQLLSVKLLKDEFISAKNKLNEIIEFYEAEKSNEQDLSSSILTRNYGYSHSIMGVYYQSKKQYKKAIESLTKATVLLNHFQ